KPATVHQRPACTDTANAAAAATAIPTMNQRPLTSGGAFCEVGDAITSPEPVMRSHTWRNARTYIDPARERIETCSPHGCLSLRPLAAPPPRPDRRLARRAARRAARRGGRAAAAARRGGPEAVLDRARAGAPRSAPDAARRGRRGRPLAARAPRSRAGRR